MRDHSSYTPAVLKTCKELYNLKCQFTKKRNKTTIITIHRHSQKSTNTLAIWVNSNIFKSVQDELYLKTALGFSFLRSISRKSRELVWAEERDILCDILWSRVL